MSTMTINNGLLHVSDTANAFTTVIADKVSAISEYFSDLLDASLTDYNSYTTSYSLGVNKMVGLGQ